MNPFLKLNSFLKVKIFFKYLSLFSIEFFEPTWILILSNLISIFGIFWYLKPKKYSIKKEKDYLIEQHGEIN